MNGKKNTLFEDQINCFVDHSVRTENWRDDSKPMIVMNLAFLG